MHKRSGRIREDTRRRGSEPLADVAVVVLGAFWLARLAGFAHGAVFQSDECFHAYASEWIAAHGRLPREIPGLYSGFAYFYAPLLHVAGAGWVRLFGPSALKELNVAVAAASLVAVWGTAHFMAGRNAGRWASALLMTSTAIAQYAVRFYVEALSTLLAIITLAALAMLERRERLREAVALGIVSGLAWLAKPSGVVLPVLWLLLAGFAAWRGRGALARGLTAAAAVTVVTASPYWLRNWMLFGSPLYPVGAPDRHALVDRMNQAKFSVAPFEFARQMTVGMGPWIAIVALAALVLGWRGKAPRMIAAAIGVCVLLTALAPLQPMVEPRHLIPFVAMLAVLGAAGLAAAARPHPRVAAAIGIVLMLAVANSIAGLRNPREEFDPDPAVTAACAAARQIVPDGDTILSLWTYDTFYDSGRAATWPIPWGQRDHPVEMFLTSDCDSVAAACARHRIGWVMLPAAPGDSVFDGGNYPRSFVRCMRQLTAGGRAEVAWRSQAMMLIRLAP